MTKQTYVYDEDAQTFIPVPSGKDTVSYAEQLRIETEKKKADDAKLYRGYL